MSSKRILMAFGFVVVGLTLSVWLGRSAQTNKIQDSAHHSSATTAPAKRTRLVRRVPDHVTDALCKVLAEDKVFGFDELFERVFENLKVRNAVSGDEEMLRLRAYEKLQNLVTRGLVEKIGREYKGTKRIHEASSEFLPQQDE